MIRNNHIIHNHRHLKKIAQFAAKPFAHIQSRKLKHIVVALVILFITVSVVKNIYVSFMCTRKVYSYPPAQIEQLKNSIETNGTWLLFNKHFPDLTASPSLPNFFQSGTSYPAFLYTKNIPYGNDCMLNLWLFAKVESLKEEVFFENCILKMIVLKKNSVISSYELTEDQTVTVLNLPSVEKIKMYLKENFYRP